MIMAYATLAVIVAMKARNSVHRLVAIGAMILIVGQSLLNIGVATGVYPQQVCRSHFLVMAAVR
jgi:cell division protein FtsW